MVLFIIIILLNGVNANLYMRNKIVDIIPKLIFFRWTNRDSHFTLNLLQRMKIFDLPPPSPPPPFRGKGGGGGGGGERSKIFIRVFIVRHNKPNVSFVMYNLESILRLINEWKYKYLLYTYKIA